MNHPADAGAHPVPRIAVVTGAARGIGEAVARTLAAAGFDVFATDLKSPASGGGAPADRITGRAMDVTDSAAIARLAEELEERFGRLDVLVNNAGVFAPTPALRLDDQTMQRILDVNLGGALRCTAAFGAVMARHGGGRIINIASVLGLGGAALASVYAASKGGMIAATRSAARELPPGAGIVVNAVAPGYCDTEMMGNERASIERLVLPRIPQKRLAAVEEVAEVVRFLASSASTYMTGSVVTVDGGLDQRLRWCSPDGRASMRALCAPSSPGPSPGSG